jgi:metallo-beta-lactamase family protein
MGSLKNTIFIVGYCAPQTPGGKLRDGATGLKLYGDYHELKAEVVVMDSFSAHGDRSEMTGFCRTRKKAVKKYSSSLS